LAVDRIADSVYLARGNLVFGFILLTRSRLWAAPQVIPPKLGLLQPALDVPATNEETCERNY
jgi:hypothetical protein